MTRTALRLSIILTGAMLLSGCDGLTGKFEIVRAGNQTFLLNKGSGEARLIDGATLVAVKPPESVSGNQAIKQAKNWPVQEIPQLGGVKLTIRTKYRDGILLYSIEATPFQGRLEKEYGVSGTEYLRQPTIYVDLYDDDGFRTGDAIDLKIRGSTRMVNEKGEPYALSWAGSQAMTLETYSASTHQSVRWAGFAKE